MILKRVMSKGLLYSGLAEAAPRPKHLRTSIRQTLNSIDITPTVLCLSLALSACGLSPDISSGIGPIDIDIVLCSNQKTQQTTYFFLDKCPAEWTLGSINECTNITTKGIELKLMPEINQCPNGFTGGKIHDECGRIGSADIGPAFRPCR